MRILHVTRELGSDRRFGIGRSLDPVVRALQARGHEVRYLTQDELGDGARAWQRRWTPRAQSWLRILYGPAGETFATIWIERLNMGRLAAKVAAREAADAVHLHDPWIGWGYRLARRALGARARWGVTEHGFGSYTDAIREEGVRYTPALLRQHRRLEASLLAAADWVVCPTRAGRAQLARDLSLPEPPAHWHAVPHARPVLSLPDRAEARLRLGWTSDQWQVLAIGRLNPVKRFEALLRACVRLGRPLRLTVLGAGDAAALRQAVPEVASSSVTLDVREVDDVAPYLAAADVYVSTTRNESFGLANLEALAAGLPALCTAAGGVPEVCGAGARWLPTGDAELLPALVQALREWSDRPALAQVQGQAGRRQALQAPDAAQVAARLEAIYRGPPGVSQAAEALHAVPSSSPAPAQAAGLAADAPLCVLPQPLPLAEARRVLVFAPHPDDESIGCGGALALLSQAGAAVRVVLVSDGSGAGGLPPGAGEVRQQEFRDALTRLGVADAVLLGLPDGALSEQPGLDAALAAQVNDFGPDWVLCPSRVDLHRDHRVVAAAARRAALSHAGVQRLCEYETWSTLPITHALDIGAVIDTKLDALGRHRTALACGAYVEATAGLARHRGLLLGVAHAEGYLCTGRDRQFDWPAGWAAGDRES
ncbi:PIG-L family deacetylase [Ideonella sp. A 288]|uniref:PIG-L family deacetylase n=1 Tax=Ideonella sp. A 288 TaxID=1962181 RepID=UPI000B4A8C0A|nr:PIG-L family deacetylase [Ideonella sp. A 288]